MKNLFKTYTKYLTITSFGFAVIASSSVYAQNVNPVAMQYTGSQNYVGNTTTMIPQRQTSPVVNSVYAQPMRRINEIPLYGKNKSVYLYDNKKVNDDSNPFADTGLYMFAGFSTGSSSSGLNSEKPIFDFDDFYIGGSDSNSSMGDTTGLMFGVGRQMSSTLSVEFIYSQNTDMNYGDYASYYEPEREEKIYDENDLPTGEVEIIPGYVDDSYFEVLDGGDISSDFIGVGLRYSLENMMGSIMGMFKPYVAVKLGLTQNTVEDYTISDPDAIGNGEYFPWEIDSTNIEELGAGTFLAEAQENITYTFIGTTTSSFGGGVEIGVSMSLGGSLGIDIFYQYNSYGTIETSGNVYSEYTDVYQNYAIINEGESCPAGYDLGTTTITVGDSLVTQTICYGDGGDGNAQTVYGGQKEEGSVDFSQYGVKLKYMF